MSQAITGLLGGMDATFQDYQQLFTIAERPRKFSAQESGFRGPALKQMPTCGECIHWFENPRSRRTVCEIVRLAGEMNIRASSTCRFQTADGIHYPLLHEI